MAKANVGRDGTDFLFTPFGHLADDWHTLSLEELLALMSMSDLLIGVDSGPLHLAGLFGIPTVGVWPAPDHLVSKYLVPRANQVSVVSSRCVLGRASSRTSRIDFT